MSGVAIPLGEVKIEDYAVLLPRLGGSEIGIYTIVTKNWSTQMFGNYDFKKESSNYGEGDNGVQMKYEEDYERGWI